MAAIATVAVVVLTLIGISMQLGTVNETLFEIRDRLPKRFDPDEDE
jgi:hypothetical protein